MSMPWGIHMHRKIPLPLGSGFGMTVPRAKGIPALVGVHLLPMR